MSGKSTLFGLYKKPDGTFEERPIQVNAAGELITTGAGGGGGGASAADIGAETNAALKASAQPVSAVALPLPNGAATEVTMAAVLAQMQGDRALAGQSFIDSAGVVYLRLLTFNSTTNTYEPAVLRFDGTVYTPVLPENPLQNTDTDTIETSWKATSAGAGYIAGDILSQFTFLKTVPTPSIVGVLWVNNGVPIATPPIGDRTKIGALAATEATLTTRLSEGTPITGEALEAGGAGGMGWFSSIRKAINAIANYFNPTVVQAGGIGPTFASIAVVGKLRRVVAQNRSGATLFLQFHQNTNPLDTGDVPLHGQIYQIANNGQVILAAADYGLHGTTAPANTKVGISTTFGTFTAHTSANASLFVETI
jgi:hypothetical protein